MGDQSIAEISLWTESDFEEMGWHDAAIHAIATPNSDFEVAFDIDYRAKWVKPAENQTRFGFWVSPVALVFWNVHDLQLEFEPVDGLTVQEIARGDHSRPKNADHIGRELEWLRRNGCNEGEASFRSCGSWRYIRKSPRLGKCQTRGTAS